MRGVRTGGARTGRRAKCAAYLPAAGLAFGGPPPPAT
jgi:hypothetical protein